LINRLEKKKVVAYEIKGRSYQYYPLISAEECAKVDAVSILERMGAVILKPVLTALIEKEQLSDEEIEEIQTILDKKAKKKK
jgi:BlaI family penicillinase repressor